MTESEVLFLEAFATKAIWNVTAGVIPGDPVEQYCKSWEYTSREHEIDQMKGPEEMTRFQEIVYDVLTYAVGLTDPSYVNWVTTSFTWI
jgi:hypothetical protein